MPSRDSATSSTRRCGEYEAHTTDYCQAVYNQLKASTSKEDVLSNLYTLRNGLEDGGF